MSASADDDWLQRPDGPTDAQREEQALVEQSSVQRHQAHASVVATLSIDAHVFEQDDLAAAGRAAAAIDGPDRVCGEGRVMAVS